MRVKSKCLKRVLFSKQIDWKYYMKTKGSNLPPSEGCQFLSTCMFQIILALMHKKRPEFKFQKASALKSLCQIHLQYPSPHDLDTKMEFNVLVQKSKKFLSVLNCFSD